MKSSNQLKSLRFRFCSAQVHHTEDALSAKANCGLVMLLWVDKAKASQKKLL